MRALAAVSALLLLVQPCRAQVANAGRQVTGQVALQVDPAFGAILSDPTSPQYQEVAQQYRHAMALSLGVPEDSIQLTVRAPPPPAPSTDPTQVIKSQVEVTVDPAYEAALRDPTSPAYAAFASAMQNSLAAQLGVPADQIQIDPTTLQATASVGDSIPEPEGNVQGAVSIALTQEYAAIMADPTNPAYATTQLALRNRIADQLGIDPSMISLDTPLEPRAGGAGATAAAAVTGGENVAGGVNFQVSEAYADQLRDPTSGAYRAFEQALREQIATQMSTPEHEVRPEDVVIDPPNLLDNTPAGPVQSGGGTVSHDVTLEVSPEFAATISDPTSPAAIAAQDQLRRSIAASLGVSPDDITMQLDQTQSTDLTTGDNTVKSEMHFNVNDDYAEVLRDPTSPAYDALTLSLRQQIASELGVRAEDVQIDPLALLGSQAAQPPAPPPSQTVNSQVAMEVSPEYASQLADPTSQMSRDTREALRAQIAANLGVDPSLVTLDDVDVQQVALPVGTATPGVSAGTTHQAVPGSISIDLSEEYRQALADPTREDYGLFIQALREQIASNIPGVEASDVTVDDTLLDQLGVHRVPGGGAAVPPPPPPTSKPALHGAGNAATSANTRAAGSADPSGRQPLADPSGSSGVWLAAAAVLCAVLFVWHRKRSRVGMKDVATASRSELGGLTSVAFDRDVENGNRFNNPTHGSARRPTEGKRR